MSSNLPPSTKWLVLSYQPRAPRPLAEDPLAIPLEPLPPRVEPRTGMPPRPPARGMPPLPLGAPVVFDFGVCGV